MLLFMVYTLPWPNMKCDKILFFIRNSLILHCKSSLTNQSFYPHLQFKPKFSSNGL